MTKAYFSIVLGALMFGIVAWTLVDARQAARRLAEKEVVNIGRILEREIGHTINSLDLSLQSAVTGMRTPGIAALNPEVRQAVLFDGSLAAQGILDLFIANKTGLITYDSQPQSARVNRSIADRDYFEAHRNRRESGLLISSPHLSRFTGEWILPFSRVVTDPDGSFAGIAAAGLRLEYLQSMFRALDVGQHGTVSLLSTDGRLVARAPFIEQDIGRDLSGRQLFRELAQKPAGSYEAVGLEGGVRRLYSYRKIDKLPLVIIIGLSTPEIFAEWSEKAIILSGVLLVSSIIGLSLALVLRRESRLRMLADQASKLSEQQRGETLSRLNVFFRHSADGLFVVHLDHSESFLFESVNPAWEGITSLSAITVVGQNPEACLPDEMGGIVLPQWRRCVLDREPIRYSYKLNRHFGALEVESVVSPVLDAKGQVCRLIGVTRDVSERNRLQAELLQVQRAANEALRKAEAFLARVGRVAGIGGYELNYSTGAVYWSEEIRRLRGVSLEYEPTLQGALDFYTPESKPVIEAAVKTALAHGGGWDLELQITIAQGRQIWVRNVGCAEFEDGKATRLIGSIQDVNASVMQRLALEEATKRVKLATDASRMGIWDWDVARGTLAWDSWMYRLYGMDHQSAAVSYRSWTRSIHPEDLDATEQALREALDGSKPLDVDYRVVWDDGSVHLLRARSSVTRDSAGVALRMVGANWDITQATELVAEVARQGERALEAAERERAIFHNSPDTLFVIRVDDAPGGPEFVYETFSPAFEQATGKRLQDMVGLRPDQCLPPEGADLVLRRYRRCVLDRASIAYEETHASPTGPRDFEGSIMPVTHPTTGRIVRLVGAVRDVTERRRTEAALQHSQKLEAVGRLSAGVAHDFNNILQGIVGGLEMILRDVSEETRAHRFADISLKAAMRGASLTHHLLSYARKQMLQPCAVELAPFLAELQALLARTLGPHIAIQMDAGQNQSVLADPGQLQTALLNLAINASHAMPKKGTLRVDTREELSDGGTWIVVTVTDTGTGMDAATLAQAAEPFFSTKGLDGSGLGLSMVQGFAVQSGGTLRITSAIGRGTTVELRLPPGGGGQGPDASEVCQTRQAAGRILLVDDATDVLITTSAFLEHSGFVVTRVQSGDEALALLVTGERFDVLVSDYAMPGMNGADLIAEARLVRPKTRALLITGYTGIDQTETHGQPVPVLHKPFKRADLLAALHGIMELRDQTSPTGVGR